MHWLTFFHVQSITPIIDVHTMESVAHIECRSSNMSTHLGLLTREVLFGINKYIFCYVCICVCKMYTSIIYINNINYIYIILKLNYFAFQELLKDFSLNSQSRWVSLNCPGHSLSNHPPGPIWGEKGRHMRNLFFSNPLCKASAKTSSITGKAVNG